MITTYHRPTQIEEALTLLNRPGKITVPLAGGTRLARAARAVDEALEVVDLQALGLNNLKQEGQLLEMGATVTLQALYEWDGWTPGLREGMRQALAQEAPENARTTATLGGTIVSADGRSALMTALLALDPRLVWADEEEAEPLGDYLILRGAPRLVNQRRLLLSVHIPLNPVLRYAQVARTPRDLPIVCAAGAVWPSGRSRLILGGWGTSPVMALDGPEAAGAQLAARSAALNAGDEWASAEYRAQVAAVLAGRVF